MWIVTVLNCVKIFSNLSLEYMWILSVLHFASSPPNSRIHEFFVLFVFGPALALIRCINFSSNLKSLVIVVSGKKLYCMKIWRKKIFQSNFHFNSSSVSFIHSNWIRVEVENEKKLSYIVYREREKKWKTPRATVNPFTIGALLGSSCIFFLLRLRLNWSTLSLIQWHARREEKRQIRLDPFACQLRLPAA